MLVICHMANARNMISWRSSEVIDRLPQFLFRRERWMSSGICWLECEIIKSVLSYQTMKWTMEFFQFLFVEVYIFIVMKIAKSTIVLLVFVLMLSILVANVADLISVDSRPLDETLGKNGETGRSRTKLYDIGKSYDHLIWFLQVCWCIFFI